MQPRIPSQVGEPAWEVTYLFPRQGQWNDSDFLRIHTNQMAELVDGRLEILPMPTWRHQLIVDFLVTKFKDHIKRCGHSGVTLFAPLTSPLFPSTIREPDILYVSQENIPKGANTVFTANATQVTPLEAPCSLISKFELTIFSVFSATVIALLLLVVGINNSS